MPANESGVTRLLVVTDDDAVYIHTSLCFDDLEFPVDRTRSFTTAAVLLAHLQYAVVVAHLGHTSFESEEELDELKGLLRRAQGTPVVLLTTTSLPADAALAIRNDVSVYFDRATPLAEVAQAVRTLLALANKRSDIEREERFTALRPQRGFLS